ncbi:MAG: hypothetical protein ACLR0U_12695 [Enterocloster clostridioformis]
MDGTKKLDSAGWAMCRNQHSAAGAAVCFGFCRSCCLPSPPQLWGALFVRRAAG